jgi:hypothetical protein
MQRDFLNIEHATTIRFLIGLALSLSAMKGIIMNYSDGMFGGMRMIDPASVVRFTSPKSSF